MDPLRSTSAPYSTHGAFDVPSRDREATIARASTLVVPDCAAVRCPLRACRPSVLAEQSGGCRAASRDVDRKQAFTRLEVGAAHQNSLAVGRPARSDEERERRTQLHLATGRASRESPGHECIGTVAGRIRAATRRRAKRPSRDHSDVMFDPTSSGATGSLRSRRMPDAERSMPCVNTSTMPFCT